MVDDLEDARRQDPPFLLEERPMLEAWLEFHRTTLLIKCEGLDDAGRKSRPIPTSLLSLHGLLRHMAEVERNWFRRVLLRQPETPPIWHDPAVDDSEFVPLDDADWEADRAAWEAECVASRRTAAGHALDDTGLRHGAPCSLRWIYVHMIEESCARRSQRCDQPFSRPRDPRDGTGPQSCARSTQRRATGHRGRVPGTVRLPERTLDRQ